MNSNTHYIDGNWQAGEGTLFDSMNPADNSIIWQGYCGNQNDTQNAYAAAKKAFNPWSKLPFSARAQYVIDFSKCIESRQQELIHLISSEHGKPHWEAKTEVDAVIGKSALSIQAHHDRLSWKETLNQNLNNALRYKPHGVVAVLGPFNFPAHLSNGHIIPALLEGNTVIYKPSEFTPAVAQFIMQCWHDVQLPKGVLNCLQGDASTATHILKHDIQGIFFTGSFRTGVAINQQFANRPGVILALEMGGNNPLIVDNIQNTTAAVYHAILSSFITSGQRCTCARRMFIPNTPSGHAFLEAFLNASSQLRVGPASDSPEPFMGPVISHQHALNHLQAQDHLHQLGGRSLLRMKLVSPEGSFLTPGVMDLTDVKNVPDEEIFAPFVQIYRYQTIDEAFQLANQTQYGLSAGLFSDDESTYQRFYQTIRAGIINWNRPTTGAVGQLPFGGIGHSGNHRPSAYFAADYCAYPIASQEQHGLDLPEHPLPGVSL